jgi:membrane-associated phospholipid phosphatase
MRTSEWIQAGFATILALAAWFRPLTFRRRFTTTLLAALVIGAVVLARLSEYVLDPLHASIFRDWLPVPLIPIPYWQTGQFFVGPNKKIEAWLGETDRRLLNLARLTGWTFGPFARLSLEWAYMLCYPLVPLGLATLCATGLRRESSTFWFIVLVPTYLCYAITLFVPALPPRNLGPECIGSATTKSRSFNLWVLEHGSIHAISFPSAHVASALAVSLVLLHYLPLVGMAFLAVSFWIAIAAVVGRYHYAIDVVLGAAMALGAFMAQIHLIPSTLIAAMAMTLTAL